MKIAMIADTAAVREPLNAPRVPHLSALSAALTGAGHKVTIYVAPEQRTAQEEVTGQRGFRVVDLHTPGKRRTAARFRAALTERLHDDRPDVVHLHSAAGTAAAAAVDSAQRLGLPLVYSAGDETDPAAGLAPPAAIAVANQIIASHTGQLRRLRSWGAPRQDITVIPHGIDVDHFTPDGPHSPGPLAHRIIAVGSLTPDSGFGTSIAALVGLPRAELVIVGGPSRTGHARQLRDYALSLGVADRVLFTGPVPRADLPALLRSADVMVCAPRQPSFHITALEAMACGVAVVANGIGGLADTVVDAVTGIHVPPRRPRALSAALAKVLGHEIISQQQGAAGRDRAAARYPWAQIVAETEHAYHRAAPVSP